MGIPAVPATVDFRMRLQRSDGSALANTWYRIRWGKADPLPAAQTDTVGMVAEVLDARYTWGVLEVGDNDPSVADDGGFVARISIELHLVKPPGSAAKHKRDKIDPDGDPPATPPKGPVPRPAPGTSGDSGDSGDPAPAQADPSLISMPPDKPRSDWAPEGRNAKHDKPAAKPASPTEAPAEAERRLDRLDRVAAEIHDKQAKVHELTWRLHNLGFLGFWSGHLRFPIDGGKYGEILDALNRYAFKHGLTLLREEDLVGADPTLDTIMAHVMKTHDEAAGSTP